MKEKRSHSMLWVEQPRSCAGLGRVRWVPNSLFAARLEGFCPRLVPTPIMRVSHQERQIAMPPSVDLKRCERLLGAEDIACQLGKLAVVLAGQALQAAMGF